MAIADVLARIQQGQAVSPLSGGFLSGGPMSMGPLSPGGSSLISKLVADRIAGDANWAKLSQTPFDQMGQARPFTATQQAAVNRVLATGGAASMPAASVPAASVPTLETVGAAASKLPLSGVGPSSTLPTLRTVGAAAQGLKPFGVGPASLLAAETPVALAGTGAAAGSPASQGLMRAGLARLGGVGNAVKAGGFRGALLPGALSVGGSMAGGALDESQLLGGSESKANDTAAKALKWGGTGAGLGLMVGGPVGGLIGAGLGGVVGVMHEGLERQGVLGTRGKAMEEANTLINETNASAAEIGLPGEVTQLLDAQYRAGLEFAKTDDEKLALAEKYAADVQEQAMAYAANPDAFAPAQESEDDLMIARSLMMSAVKPYADNFLAQSSAEADMYAGMANGAGNMAPMYTQMAANTRARGARQAMETVQEAQVTPYTEALRKQAGYLNQMSNSLVSQAMGQVMAPQQSGGDDLTAIIDANVNQMQPT